MSTRPTATAAVAAAVLDVQVLAAGYWNLLLQLAERLVKWPLLHRQLAANPRIKTLLF